jgi:hypothetical protein
MPIVVGVEVRFHHNDLTLHIRFLGSKRHGVRFCVNPGGGLVRIATKFSTNSKVGVETMGAVFGFGTTGSSSWLSADGREVVGVEVP